MPSDSPPLAQSRSSQSDPTWLLRTDADQDLGLGHLNRMMAMAECARRRGVTARFALKHRTNRAHDSVVAAGFDVFVVDPQCPLDEEHAWLYELVESEQTDALLWDVSHQKTPREAPRVGRYLTGYPHQVTTCVIDGMGATALVTGFAHQRPIDLLVVPYAGAAVHPNARVAQRLLGPRYAIISDGLRRCVRRRVDRPRDRSRRLLVTAGGADPQRITELVLHVVASTPALAELDVTVVVGPLFGPGRLRDILQFCNRRGRFRAVHAPATLCEVLLWADIAVATTGLTKYELALFGIPSVFISGDEEHHAANRAFSDCGTGIDVGLMGEETAAAVAEGVSRLMGAPRLREALARRGRALIDEHGADRIASAILSADGRERAGA